jgi:hypothetical protein
MPVSKRSPRVVGRQTLWIPASAMWSTVSNGAGSIIPVEVNAANSINIQGLPFFRTGNTDRYAQFDVAMPKGWDEGIITASFNWTTLAAETGTKNVVWGLQGRSIGDGGAIDATYGTIVTAQDLFIAAKTEHVSVETAAITIAGAGEGKRTVFRVVRQGSNTSSDTLVQEALLLGIRLFYNTATATDN